MKRVSNWYSCRSVVLDNSRFRGAFVSRWRNCENKDIIIVINNIFETSTQEAIISVLSIMEAKQYVELNIKIHAETTISIMDHSIWSHNIIRKYYRENKAK